VQAGGRVPARPDRDITVANLNILHGFACDPPVPDDGDQCRVKDRIALLVEHLIAAGCPDIVTLQENVTERFVGLTPPVVVGPLTNTVALIRKHLPVLAAACGFRYQVVFDPEGATRPPPAELGRGIDEELILTRYPVLHAEVFPLYSPLAPFFFRHVLFARIAHKIEPVDVFTTHLAADADFGAERCGVNVLPPPVSSPSCPDACEADDTVRECQAKQMAHFIELQHDIPGAGFITGDINADAQSPVYDQFVSRGWLDSHLAAGNAECDPNTGLNCTAGREDQDLSDLEDPALNQRQRIDFIFVIEPDEHGSQCQGDIDPSEDYDRDGFSTGLFAAEPNPFAPACGPAPLPVCWASDHSGTQLDLNCKRSRSPRNT